MTRWSRFFIQSLCVIGMVSLVGCPIIPDSSDLNEGDTSFKSANPFGSSSGGSALDGLLDLFTPGVADGAGDEATNDDDGGQGSAATREIEEADLAKLVGDKLYVLNRYRGLRVVDLSTWSEPKIVGGASFVGEPIEMYIVDDLAIVVTRQDIRCRLDRDGKPTALATSTVTALDISDPTSPSIVGTFDLDGYVAESRRVGEVIYLAGYAQQPWGGYWIGSDSDGSTSSTTDDPNDSFIVSISIADPTHVTKVAQKDFAGYADYIHATAEAIFVSGYDWATGRTTIQMADISDPAGAIVLKDTCSVPGQIISRFAMDASNGVLRVVSDVSRWQLPDGVEWPGDDDATTLVKLYAFDLSNPSDISLAGSLKLIQNETVRAVRFAGEVGYVVTFEQTDPLWVVDLRDATAPAITGHLEVPGYSTTLVPDGTKLLAMGIGEDWRAAVSLYDVSDPAKPVRLGAKSLGETWSWSEANSDDKAFTVVSAGKLVLAPYNEWTEDGTSSKLAMLSYAEDTLTSLATLAHRGSVIRSGVNDDVSGLWILSHEQLQTVDISTPTKPESLATLAMAEYVVRYAVIGDVGVRIAWPGYSEGSAAIEVQTTDAGSPNGASQAMKSFDDFSLYGMKVANGRILLLGQTSTYAARLIAIDAAALPEISVTADQTFDFAPCQQWSWYYYYAVDTVGAMVDKARSSAKSVEASECATVMPASYSWMISTDWPIVLSNGTIAVLGYGGTAENADYATMVLRLITIDGDDATIVRAIDLSESTDTHTYCRFGAVGNTLYFTDMAIDGGWRWSASDATFALYRIDATNAVSATLDAGVNVPGVAVKVTNDAVYTIDPYWNDETLKWRFCSLDLSNDTATLRRSLNLDTSNRSISQVIAHDGLAAVNFSDGWYWPVYYGAAEDDVAVAKASDSACEMGSSAVVMVNVTMPTALAVTGTLDLDATTTAMAMSNEHIVLSVDGSCQLIVATIDDSSAPILDKVVDLPGGLVTVTMPSEDVIDAVCGYGGVAKIEE